ncbi:zinc finger CCCH domain-containing protein 19, partial [Tanacetum coccineum]
RGRVWGPDGITILASIPAFYYWGFPTPVPIPGQLGDFIIAPSSTPPGNDLNIAAESGSSWIDYIGPLTSDEIDSDKRWSYRDPNGIIHGLFSLAQLRSWKDYFPSDLQIWSYYGNVKEAILLHNALSRQTKCENSYFLKVIFYSDLLLVS